MNKYFLVITIISLLWHTCLSTQGCNRTIIEGMIIFSCPSNITTQELELYDLDATQLDNITSFIGNGINAASVGPFTSMPPNICLLRNLQSISLSNNQIGIVDPTGSFTSCLSNIITLDLSVNMISEFPSVMIYNMQNLKNLYLQANKLTEVPANAFLNISSFEIINFSNNQLTTFELWALEVQIQADFSNNDISTITNKYFFDKFLQTTSELPSVSLNNNGPTINFTDAVYEMYNQCEEVYQWYFSNIDNPLEPFFTYKLTHIDFGTTEIICSCDQAYFLRILGDAFGDQDFPITNTMCAKGSLSSTDTFFVNSSCASPLNEVNSTVNFSEVYPRLCKIVNSEEGELTNETTIGPPVLNVSTYPHYISAFLHPGACFFNFLSSTTMTMRCTNDTSNTLSTLPESLLSNTYLSKITRVIYPTPISSFPSYLCALPSHEIDLSYQSFTILDDTTFPCLDSFHTVNLSFNQLTTVSMSNGDFKTLNSLDLSSNLLTMLPYSILHPTPTSLRYLDLHNNSIHYIDLFIYTLQNITINLDDNPINSSDIINLQNITLTNNTNSTANIIFPSTVTNSTIIIDDTIAVIYGLCNNFQSLRNYLLNLRSTIANVFLRCTCASINLRQLYQQNGYNITNDFNCSNTTDEQTFYNLNIASCSNATSFQTGLCFIETTQTSTNMITMETLSTTIELTSTSLTILMTNSSSSSSALNTTNEIQSTTSNEFQKNSTNSEVTFISTINTSQITLSPSTNTTATSSSSSSINNISIITNSTVITSTTMITSSSMISTALNSTALPLQSGNSSSSSGNGTNSSNTALIVGLVVGLVGFAALVVILVIIIKISKSRGAAASAKKPVSRAAVVSQTPGDSLASRIQPRNLRSMRLAPITSKTSQLPSITIPPKTNSSTLPYNNLNLRKSTRGIPIRLDPIRPPNSNALNNSSNFRPINNLSTNQFPTPQHVSKPRPNQLLNTGGDPRY